MDSSFLENDPSPSRLSKKKKSGWINVPLLRSREQTDWDKGNIALASYPHANLSEGAYENRPKSVSERACAWSTRIRRAVFYDPSKKLSEDRATQRLLPQVSDGLSCKRRSLGARRPKYSFLRHDCIFLEWRYNSSSEGADIVDEDRQHLDSRFEGLRDARVRGQMRCCPLIFWPSKNWWRSSLHQSQEPQVTGVFVACRCQTRRYPGFPPVARPQKGSSFLNDNNHPSIP